MLKYDLYVGVVCRWVFVPVPVETLLHFYVMTEAGARPLFVVARLFVFET